MRSKLIARLEQLEAAAPTHTGPIWVGWTTPLPHDYVGERHTAITKMEPPGPGDVKWCQFEERAGPLPPGKPVTWMAHDDGSTTRAVVLDLEKDHQLEQ